MDHNQDKKPSPVRSKHSMPLIPLPLIFRVFIASMFLFSIYLFQQYYLLNTNGDSMESAEEDGERVDFTKIINSDDLDLT